MQVAKGDMWQLINGDSCEELPLLKASSIDLAVFSPPFASLYTYSDSPHDLGNCDNQGQFFEHFRWIIKGLRHAMRPGRIVAIHCMALPTSKCRDGVIGLTDFPGKIIQAMQQEEFVYHSEVCIWKDPVTAMQRTKALGLLYKQLKKDSCMSRQGIADKLVVFRAPGTNDKPVVQSTSTFPLAADKVPDGEDTRKTWQNYASPVWMDINQSNTLSRIEARDDKDERHICPLQLEVIERCVDLWTNPGDTVLSPFAGIGSEGYVSVLKGRRFMGIELKDSYWKQAKKNLDAAEVKLAEKSLFKA